MSLRFKESVVHWSTRKAAGIPALALLIADLIDQRSAGELKPAPISVSDLQDVTGHSRDVVVMQLQWLRRAAFVDWRHGAGYWTTPAYRALFDPPGVGELADGFVQRLNELAGTAFRPGSKPVRRRLLQLLRQDRRLTLDHFELVIRYCQEVEYTRPEQKTYLRPMTLLNTRFFDRLESALEWKDRKLKKIRGTS